MDSAFVIGDHDTAYIAEITKCQQLAMQGGDKDSRLFLELRKYIIYRNSGKPFPFLSAMIDSLSHVAERGSAPFVNASIQMLRGWLYQDNNDYLSAFESYLRTYQLLQTLSVDDFPNKDYFLYTIANAFYQFHDLTRAIEIASEVSDQPKAIWIKTLNSNLLGLANVQSEHYDSARYWFLDALKSVYLPDNIKEDWQGLIQGNIGNTWYKQGDLDKPIPFFEEAVQKAEKTQMWDVAGGFSCKLAEIYLQKGDSPKALPFLEKADRYIRIAPGDDDLMHLHDMLSKYYRQAGDDRQTLLHLDSMLYYKSFVEKATNQQLKIQAEFNFENEKRVSREHVLQAEIKRQRITRNLIICILFLLMALGILYYTRQRMKDQYARRILQEEKRIAAEELENARVQLEDFTRSLKEKNTLLERLGEEVQKLQTLPSHVITAEQIDTFAQLRMSAILTDADWDEFRSRFDKVHAGFLQRLRVRLPDLSPAETRFMALAKLQLNNKEMASILGISPDSIRTIRYRLRKKLHLAEEGSMEELVNSV